MTKTFVLISSYLLSASSLDAQTDSIGPKIYLPAGSSNAVYLKSTFLPMFLTGYGLFAMKNEELKELDNNVKDELWTEPIHKPITVDNYLQYAPALSVFALQAAGVPGKNSVKDEILLYLMSNAVMGAVVNPLKYATHLQRPDGFGKNAFPSGHTATAFAAAEFLNQEYKDRSPWYSVAAYTMATGVGFMRIYNNRHWMRDVATGAGIGMLSTKFSYWLYPKIQKSLFEKKELRKERTSAMSLDY